MAAQTVEKRTSRLSRRNNINTDRRQMEGSDPARFDARRETVRRTEKIHWQCFSKGPYRSASRYGKKTGL